MKNKSTIKDMFSMKRGTYNNVPLSNEFRDAQKKMFNAVDAFLEKLTAEQQTLFHEAFELISNQNAVYAEDHYVEGFKFGLLIGIEAGDWQTNG